MPDSDTQVDIRKQLVPGARVKVTQQIAARDYSWPTTLRGTVVDYAQKETGSWFAHAKDDKLWLDRLTIRKDDGEITTLNLDDYTRIEVEEQAARGEGQAPEEKTGAASPQT
jgi:hypothetical protein